MIDQDRLGHLDQAVLATDRPAIDVRVVHGLWDAGATVASDADEVMPGQERRTRIAVTVEEDA